MVSALTALVNIPSDNLRTELARKELYALLVGMMEETPENCLIRVQKLLHGLTEFVLLKVLLTKVMKSHCFYGNIISTEVTFLHFISKIGIDVLYICSNTANAEIINAGNLDNRMQVFVLPELWLFSHFLKS